MNRGKEPTSIDVTLTWGNDHQQIVIVAEDATRDDIDFAGEWLSSREAFPPRRPPLKWEKAGSNAEEPPVWICVEESLPSYYNQVWVRDEIAGVVTGWRCAPEQYLDTGIEAWRTGMVKRAVSLQFVTHWQPIAKPEPPGWPD